MHAPIKCSKPPEMFTTLRRDIEQQKSECMLYKMFKTFTTLHRDFEQQKSEACSTKRSKLSARDIERHCMLQKTFKSTKKIVNVHKHGGYIYI